MNLTNSPRKTAFDAGTVKQVSGQTENRSLGRRVLASAIKWALGPDTVNAWMGPGQVVPPTQQDEAGRLFDYPTAINAQSRPRSTEGFTFETLRQLADAYDLMRLVIEKRKDQMERLKFKFVTADVGDDDTIDPRVKVLTQFFKYPDNVNPWGTWLRMAVEEILVIDALTLYPRKTYGGQLYSLDIMDGGTIKVLVDGSGRRPIAPEPAYQQWIKGSPMAMYTADELMYLPRNPRANRFYGFSPVEQVAMTVNIALRRQTHQLNYYTEGNIPEAFIPTPEGWTPKQVREFQRIWDSMIGTADKRKAKFIPNVKNVIFTREPTLKDEMDEWLARIICFAFSYPPSALTQLVNRATAQTQQETAEEEGLAPLMHTVKQVMDRIIATHYGWDDISFEWESEKAIDPAIQATVHTQQIESGEITLDEGRKQLGLQPLNIKGQTDVPKFMREPSPQMLADAAAKQAKGLDAAGQELPPGKDGKPSPQAADGGNSGTPNDSKGKGQDEGDVKKAASVTDAMLKAQRRAIIRKNERKLSTAVAAALHNAGEAVAEAYALSFTKLAKVSEETVSDFLDALVIQIDAASGAVKEAIEAVALDGAARGMAKVDISTATELNLANTNAAAYAEARAAELITTGPGGGGLADSTRQMIRAMLTKAAEDGATNEAVAKMLRESYAFSADRAMTIARTELRMADVQGNLAAYKASGVVSGKRWLLSNDHDYEDECNENADEGVIKLDTPFSSGDMGPPAHPNCQCDIAPVIE